MSSEKCRHLYRVLESGRNVHLWFAADARRATEKEACTATGRLVFASTTSAGKNRDICDILAALPGTLKGTSLKMLYSFIEEGKTVTGKMFAVHWHVSTLSQELSTSRPALPSLCSRAKTGGNAPSVRQYAASSERIQVTQLVTIWSAAAFEAGEELIQSTFPCHTNPIMSLKMVST